MSARPIPRAASANEVIDEESDASRLVEKTISVLLRSRMFTAEEIFGIRAVREFERNARDMAYARLRAAIADAMEHPTPANNEAAGKAAAWVCRMAMADTARDYLDLYGVDQ